MADINLTITAPEPVRVVHIGQQGAPGISGGAVYTHIQSVAASTWTINHNLNAKPSCSLFDLGGNEFAGNKTHLNPNQIQVTLTSPIAGTARCT